MIAITVTKVSKSKVNKVLFKKFCRLVWFEIITCSILFVSTFTILNNVLFHNFIDLNTPLYSVCRCDN